MIPYAFLLALGLAVPAAMAGPPVQTPGVPQDLSNKDWGAAAQNKGVVSVAKPLAAAAGAEMLAKGGNAIDAAAAIQFALNVEMPMMAGIGGGCFIMYYSAKDKKTYVIDGRERAPAKAKPDQFLDANGNELPFDVAESTGTAAGVPGTLMGTATALKSFGTMSPSEVMQPAIKTAREGFTITKYAISQLRPPSIERGASIRIRARIYETVH